MQHDVMNLKLQQDKSNKHKKKHITETDKMKMAITQLNLFNATSENNNNELIDELRSQNQGLQDRVKKLQSDKEKLKKKISEQEEDNKQVGELKSEIEELTDSLKLIEQENEKQDKEIQIKDHEIDRLNRELLKVKHKKEKEKDKSNYKDMNDDDINEIIDECDENVNKLKSKLYEIMEMMKTIDSENNDLKQQIDLLKKQRIKDRDALTSDYDAIRNALNDKNDDMIPNNVEQRKHKRKSSKILRKTARFEKWILNDVALPQYIQNFHDNGYDRIDVVKTLNESDLKEIGILKVGHRRLLIEKIQELNELKSSSPNIDNDNNDNNDNKDKDQEQEEEKEKEETEKDEE